MRSRFSNMTASLLGRRHAGPSWAVRGVAAETPVGAAAALELAACSSLSPFTVAGASATSLALRRGTSGYCKKRHSMGPFHTGMRRFALSPMRFTSVELPASTHASKPPKCCLNVSPSVSYSW